MERLKQAWKKVPVAVRKPLILVVGTVVVIGGVILLPLPGPGWVVIFFGFAILATEFAFAERLRDWMVKQVKGWLAYARHAWREKRLKPPPKP